MKIALQLYSVRWEAAEDLRATLERVKALGYDGVEFAGLHGHTPEQIKAWCEELSLEPISAHVPYPELVQDTDATLTQYRAIGCSYVAIPWLGEQERPGGAGFDEAVEHIGRIGERARAFGMQLLYHNHDFEFVCLQGKRGLDVLYERVDADRLATELDTCWVRVGGEDPAAYVRKYKGRAPVVHLKDYVGSKSEHMYELIGVDGQAQAPVSTFEFRSVGAGVQDFVAILDAAREAGAAWVVVEQDQPSAGLSPMEAAGKSLAYIHTIL